MSTSASHNRRSFYRQAMCLRVDLRVSGLRIAVPATLVDLSAGGCQLHARTMLQPQSACEFNLPREGMPPLRLPGKLRKVTYTAHDRTFRYAVGFDSLNDATRDALSRFIHEEQRKAIATTKRGGDDDLSTKPKPSTRLQELRAHRRAEVNIPVQYSVKNATGSHEAIAIDVSTGGIRVLTDQVLRQEWELVLRFKLPDDVLSAINARNSRGIVPRPFQEVRLAACALPGVKQTRGRYVQSLVWIDPDPEATQEIDRFIEAARLTALRRR